MREMIMLRDFHVRTTSGFNAKFKANVPKMVHPYCVEEAIAAGATFVDGSQFAPKEKEAEPEPLYGFERESALYDALMRLKDKSDPDDFTANSLPTIKAAVREVGFDVDRTEVDKAWKKILQARANAL